LTGDGLVQLAFSVLPGRSYQIEYKNRLDDAAWTPLLPPALADQHQLTAQDNIHGLAQRFYRLVVLP
jgi:hypothetical protein